MEAADLIRQAINNPIADIHFVCGGTQANLLVLSSILRPYESVIAVESGHISIHEAGAIPEAGQIFTFHGFRFEVMRRVRNRITALKVTPQEATAED